jgi:hypothetical protein
LFFHFIDASLKTSKAQGIPSKVAKECPQALYFQLGTNREDMALSRRPKNKEISSSSNIRKRLRGRVTVILRTDRIAFNAKTPSRIDLTVPLDQDPFPEIWALFPHGFQHFVVRD